MPVIIPAPSSIALGVTVIQSGRIQPMDSRTAISSTTVTADLAYLLRFAVPTPMTVSVMEYYCATAAGNVDLGIFTTTDFTAFTLLASTGATLAAGASAIQAISLTASIVVVPGVEYYAALVGNNAGLTIGRTAPLSAVVGPTRMCFQKAALDPLATFSTPTNGTLMAWMAVR